MAKQMSPFARELMDRIFSNGSFSGLVDVEPEVVQIARKHFPDIGQDLILQNYAAFRQLAEQNRECGAAQFGDVVKDVRLVPKINSRGGVSLSVVQVGGGNE